MSGLRNQNALQAGFIVSCAIVAIIIFNILIRNLCRLLLQCMPQLLRGYLNPRDPKQFFEARSLIESHFVGFVGHH